MHGYEMIQEIAERSGGAWKPSPGSVYPTLQLLEDEGLIASESEGGKKLFSLTEAGRAAAEEGPDAPWEEASRGVDWEALGEIRQAGFGLMEAFGQVWKTGSKEQREKALGRHQRSPQEAVPDPRRRGLRVGPPMAEGRLSAQAPPGVIRGALLRAGCQVISPSSLRSDSFRAAVAESLSLPAINDTAAPVNSPSMRTVVASPSGVRV